MFSHNHRLQEQDSGISIEVYRFLVRITIYRI